VKTFLRRVALRMLARMPRRGPRLEALFRRLYLADLAKRDMVQWRVAKAREMGVHVGEDCRFYSLNIFSEPNLVEIGDKVIVSGEVIFLTHDGGVHTLSGDIPNLTGHYGRIRIGNNCFIGMGAIILPNVQLGDNSVVGAGAVVFESFPANSVLMGNPAKRVFSRDIYLQMRKNSPFTITDERYRFPIRCPPEVIRERIGHLPVREPRGMPRSSPR